MQDQFDDYKGEHGDHGHGHGHDDHGHDDHGHDDHGHGHDKGHAH